MLRSHFSQNKQNEPILLEISPAEVHTRRLTRLAGRTNAQKKLRTFDATRMKNKASRGFKSKLPT
jgi:hypothetical protein